MRVESGLGQPILRLRPSNGGQRSGLEMTGSFCLWKPTSPNIADSGCGRLRRPPSQTAVLAAELGNQISGVSVAEPGNPRVVAVSESAGSLGDIG